jgi:hypothetical protein
MKDKVLYIIIGVLIGVVVMQWQQGPQTAQAQAPEPISGYRVQKKTNNSDTMHFVMLTNGDVYMRESQHDWSTEPLRYFGNFWGGPPVQTNQSTWGAIKALNNSD